MKIINARLRHCSELFTLTIQNGTWSHIEQQTTLIRDSSASLDAQSQLISLPFIEPHIHLDAALTAGEPNWNMSGTLFEGIQRWSERKPMLSSEDIRHRAYKTLDLLVKNGIQFVRTHADVSDPSLVGLKTLCDIRDEVKGKIELQVVAFPQDGLLSFPNGLAIMEEALEYGADVVGGIPHFEFTRVKELTEAGMNVCFGQDSINDPWYSLGNGKLLRTLDFGLHICHMMGRNDFEKSLDLITTNSARTLNINDQYAINVGKPANFILLDGEDDYTVLRNQSEVLMSVHQGNVLVRKKASEVLENNF